MAEFEAFEAIPFHARFTRAAEGVSMASAMYCWGRLRRKLDAQGKDYLQRVCDGIKNMGKLIDANAESGKGVAC